MHKLKHIVVKIVAATTIFSCDAFSGEKHIFPREDLSNFTPIRPEDFVYKTPERHTTKILKTPCAPSPLILEPERDDNKDYTNFNFYGRMHDVQLERFSADRCLYRNAPELEYLLLIERRLFKRTYSHKQLECNKRRLLGQVHLKQLKYNRWSLLKQVYPHK